MALPEIVILDLAAQDVIELFGQAPATSGGAGRTEASVDQTAHGLAALNAIRHNGSAWVKAQADSADTLATAVVVEVADVDTFTLAMAGIYTVTAHGLTVGQYYFLSSATAGALTTTEPAYSQPLLYVVDADTVLVLPYRPSVGAQTQGALNKTSSNTSYTLSDADCAYTIYLTAGSAIAVTIPPGLMDNFECVLVASGAGQITVGGGLGVTLESEGGKLKSRAQHAHIYVGQRTTETYSLAGGLTT